MRCILYITIGCFFASVEQKRRPELAGKPVIVWAPKGGANGVVVSVSKEAAEFGAHDGMSLSRAHRSCPDAVVLRADYASYRQVSNAFLDILAQYSPLLEPDVPGAAYMDVGASRSLFGDSREIAVRIASEVSERLGMRVSIGCASNKLLAKIVSQSGCAARGFTLVPPGSESEFLSPFPVTVLEAVNDRIAKRLGELGISSVGRIAAIPERLLVRQFGPVGSVIKRQSLGMDFSEVRAAYPPEVIMIEHTFDTPLGEPAEVEERLRMMTAEALFKLRKRGGLAGEVVLGLQVSNLDLQPVGFFRFKRPTDSAPAVVQALLKLLNAKMKPGMWVLGAQITLSELSRGESSQLCLIGTGERKRRLDRAVELIRERFGERSVFIASSLVPAGRARALTGIAVC